MNCERNKLNLVLILIVSDNQEESETSILHLKKMEPMMPLLFHMCSVKHKICATPTKKSLFTNIYKINVGVMSRCIRKGDYTETV